MVLVLVKTVQPIRLCRHLEAQASTIASATLDSQASIPHVQRVVLEHIKLNRGRALVKIAPPIPFLPRRALQFFNAHATPGSPVPTAVLARYVPSIRGLSRAV